MASAKKRLSGARIYTRSRMGDASARSIFEEIWHHFYPRIYVFVRRMPVDINEVEDLVQEIMLKAYRKLRSYRPDYAFSAWIYTIARNHCLDRMKSNGLRDIQQSNMDTVPGRYPSPEVQAIQNEEIRRLGEMIKLLPGNDQHIAFLKFYEGMSYQQISSVLSIPVGTLKYRVHAIRRRITSQERKADA